jgi:bacterioferritin-associated ferredoxin
LLNFIVVVHIECGVNFQLLEVAWGTSGRRTGKLKGLRLVAPPPIIGKASLTIDPERGGVLVCHCKAVYDREVRHAIAAGARDEFDVAEACGAGSGCGGCVPSVTSLLAEAGWASGCPVTSALRAALEREGSRHAANGVRR